MNHVMGNLLSKKALSHRLISTFLVPSYDGPFPLVSIKPEIFKPLARFCDKAGSETFLHKCTFTIQDLVSVSYSLLYLFRKADQRLYFSLFEKYNTCTS